MPDQPIANWSRGATGWLRHQWVNLRMVPRIYALFPEDSYELARTNSAISAEASILTEGKKMFELSLGDLFWMTLDAHE